MRVVIFESIAKIIRLYLLAKDIPAVGLYQVCTGLTSCSKYCRNPEMVLLFQGKIACITTGIMTGKNTGYREKVSVPALTIILSSFNI